MNTYRNNLVKQSNVISILNANIITEEKEKEALQTMGLSSCQVACMSYKCCTGHGSGGKHSIHSCKIKH